MVRKTAMASATGGGDGDSGEGHHKGKDELASTKDKMRLQQRLIDMAARDLESTRISRREIDSEHSHSALEENILLLEVSVPSFSSRTSIYRVLLTPAVRALFGSISRPGFGVQLV